MNLKNLTTLFRVNLNDFTYKFRINTSRILQPFSFIGLLDNNYLSVSSADTQTSSFVYCVVLLATATAEVSHDSAVFTRYLVSFALMTSL